MAATTYISLDVALTITSALEPGDPKQSLHSVSLFILTTIWPSMCVLLSLPLVPRMTPGIARSAALLYFVLMTWIVARVLHETRPLVYYILAAILFVLAQLAYFLLSRPICDGTNAKIDGSFVATALETTTVIVLYLAWQGITEGSCFSRPVCGLMCSSSTLHEQTIGMTHTFRNESRGLSWPDDCALCLSIRNDICCHFLDLRDLNISIWILASQGLPFGYHFLRGLIRKPLLFISSSFTHTSIARREHEYRENGWGRKENAQILTGMIGKEGALTADASARDPNGKNKGTLNIYSRSHSHSRKGLCVMVCTTSTQIHDSPSSRDPSRPSFANMLAALDARRCGDPVIVA